MFDRIVVGLDGSKLAEQVLPHAEAFASRYGGRLVLLRAVGISPIRALGGAVVAPAGPGPLLDPTPHLQEELLQATNYLTTLADRLQTQGLIVEQLTPNGHPADAILEAARDGSNFIALTTHGHTGLVRAVLGSIVADVVRRATCPVLVVRASEATSG